MEILEKTAYWGTFPGTEGGWATTITFWFRYIELTGKQKKSERERLIFGRCDRYSDTYENNPPDEDDMELDMPGSLFVRGVEAAIAGRKTALPGHGSFEPDEDYSDKILYTTECAQEYRFQKSDLQQIVDWYKS